MSGAFDARVARLGWQQLVRSRKFVLACVVSALPLVAGFLTIVEDGLESDSRGYRFSTGFTEPAAFFVMAGTIPFAALILAGGLVADDVEDRTLTYLVVRPVRRRTLYLSRLVPVAAATALLAAVQVAELALMRTVAWLMYGMGTSQPLSGTGYTAAGAPLETIGSGLLLARIVPAALLAAVVVAVVLATLFGFVSLVTTRFHFVANLLVFLVWELLFGMLGGTGFGFLTATFHAQSILDRMDPSHAGTLTGWTLNPITSLILMSGWVVLWAVAGMRLMARRDFNITSAAS